MSQADILQPAKTELSSEHFAFWFVLATLPDIGFCLFSFLRFCLFVSCFCFSLFAFFKREKGYQVG